MNSIYSKIILKYILKLKEVLYGVYSITIIKIDIITSEFIILSIFHCDSFKWTCIQIHKSTSFVSQDDDKYETAKEMSGICRLTIKNCEIEDSGEYSCRIEKQEDKTTTLVTIIGK